MLGESVCAEVTEEASDECAQAGQCQPMQCLSNDEFTSVALRLAGKHTPIGLQKTRGCEDSSNTENGTRSEHGDEEDLRGLFDDVTARAEEKLGESLQSSDAWRQILQLLPLVARVQSLLLCEERSRCRQHEERRGRSTSVRFACYDLSAVDLRPSTFSLAAVASPASTTRVSSSQDELVTVLADVVSKQRELMDTCSVRGQARSIPSRADLSLCRQPRTAT